MLFSVWWAVAVWLLLLLATLSICSFSSFHFIILMWSILVLSRECERISWMCVCLCSSSLPLLLFDTWMCMCVCDVFSLPFMPMFVFGYRSNAVGYCHISCCQIKYMLPDFLPMHIYIYLLVYAFLVSVAFIWLTEWWEIWPCNSFASFARCIENAYECGGPGRCTYGGILHFSRTDNPCTMFLQLKHLHTRKKSKS